MSGEHLDVSSTPPQANSLEQRGRPYVGVHFACCGVYARIYRNADATAYAGNCPKCARALRLRIAPGGNEERFFTVS